MTETQEKALVEVKEQFVPHNARVITSESLRELRRQKRLRRAISEINSGAPAKLDKPAQRQWYTDRERRLRELEEGKIPYMAFPEGFSFKDYGRVLTGDKNNVFELTTQGQFGAAFSKRLEYEVDAGRDMEPIVYTPIYDQMVNAGFEENFEINTLRDVGVVMTQFLEGGEVQFATVGSGSHTIKILQYAAGIRYTDKLFLYNKTWMMPPIEREFGKATNALHNHSHLNPILEADYATAGKQTAASTVGDTVYEKTANTLDAAVSTSVKDKKDPRRGPYVLLCSLSQLTLIERSLGRVPQEGFNRQPSSLGQIRTIIAYDGWSGNNGKEDVTYAGVTSGKAYLIHTGHREFDFQSKVKIPFRRQEAPGELSRFIAREIVFDTHYGLYAAPTRAVQEVTLPTYP